MPSSEFPEPSDALPSAQTTTADRSSEIATTNYGSQVAYNYGSISNYFCNHDDAKHQHNTPAITSPISRKTQLSDKIERAHRLYTEQRWTEAKSLFYEVLLSHDNVPELSETIHVKYTLAHAHFSLKEYREAADHFNDVADVREENPEIFDTNVNDSRYWLARSNYHQSQYEEAAWHLELFIQAQPGHDYDAEQQAITAHLWLGLTFDRLTQYDRAQDQLEMAYKMRRRASGSRNLETLSCRHHLANFLFKRNEFSKACDHFGDILAAEELLVGPERSQAIKTRFMLAWSLAKLARLDEADPHFQRVYAHLSLYQYLNKEEGKNFGVVCYWLARIALRRRLSRHELLNAQADLQRAVRLLSVDEDLREELVDCRLRLATIMAQEGHVTGAEQVFRTIVDISSTSDDNSLEGRLGLAGALMQQRKFDEAKSCLEAVVDIEKPLSETPPTNDKLAACFHLLGNACAKLRHFPQAKICFERVIDHRSGSSVPSRAAARFDLAQLFFELREFEDARSHFQQARDEKARIEPGSEIISQIWLTWTLCELESFDDAESSSQASLAYIPGIGEVPSRRSDFMIGHNDYYRACISLHRQDSYQAVTMCRSALPRLHRHKGPGYRVYIQCLYQHARALVLLREYDEAQPKLQELMRSQPKDDQARKICNVLAPFWLGVVNIGWSRYGVAEPLLKQCLNALVTGLSLNNTGFARHDVHYYHAVCLCYTKRQQGSIEILHNLLSLPVIEQKYVDVRRYSRMMLGHNLFYLDRAAEAYEHIELFLKEHSEKGPKSGGDKELAMNSGILAACLCETQRFEEAQPLLASAAAASNTAVGSRLSLLKGLANGWLGRNAFEKGLIPRAQNLFELAQSLITLNSRSRHKIFDRMFYMCGFFLARIHLREKNYAIAGSLLRELAAQQTSAGFSADAIDSQYWLGRSLQKRGDYHSAMPIFRKIIENKVDAKFLGHTLARCFHELGECLYHCKSYEEAKTHLKLSLTHSEGRVAYWTHYFLGLSNYRLGQFDESRCAFTTTLEEAGHDTLLLSCRYWLGMSNFKLANFEDSKLYLQLAYESADESWDHGQACQFHLARASFELAQYDIANGHFASVVSGANKGSKQSKPTTILESQCYLGRCWVEQRQCVEGKVVLSLLVTKLEQSQPQDELVLNSARFYLALCHARLRCFKQAIAEFESLVPFFDGRPLDENCIRLRIYYELGCARSSRSERKEALDWFRKALHGFQTIEDGKKFDVPECQTRIGTCLSWLRRFDEASQAFRDALKSYQNKFDTPNQVLIDTQFNLSRMLCRAGSSGAALPHAAESFKLQEQLSGPDHDDLVPHLLVLGQVAYALFDHEQAEQLFARALSRYESSTRKKKLAEARLVAASYAQRAMIFAASKKTSEARMMAEKAIQMDNFSDMFWLTELPDFVELFPDVVARKGNDTRSLEPKKPERKKPEPKKSGPKKPAQKQAEHKSRSDTLKPPSSTLKKSRSDKKQTAKLQPVAVTPPSTPPPTVVILAPIPSPSPCPSQSSSILTNSPPAASSPLPMSPSNLVTTEKRPPPLKPKPKHLIQDFARGSGSSAELKQMTDGTDMEKAG